jgi:hypothetical protein
MPNFPKQTLYYVVDTVFLKRNTHIRKTTNTPTKMSATFKQTGQVENVRLVYQVRQISHTQKNFFTCQAVNTINLNCTKNKKIKLRIRLHIT